VATSSATITWQKTWAASPTGLASERARREGRLRFANKHLKRIRYANATPHDASSYRLELVLDYGDHDPEVPSETPSGPWLARQDPSSTHRPGFDLRSYRLLRRALMFHRFSELGDHRLVRSLDLGYAESPKLTQLVSATIVGYSWAGTTYARQELPSVTLGYTAAVLQRAIATIPRQELRDLEPTQLNKTAQWVDLDGEGLPGVLTQRRGAHHYKPNRGGAQLGPGRLLDSAPNLPAGGAQLMDLDGGGDLAMVRLDPRGGGYQERTRSGWGPFPHLRGQPRRRLRLPALEDGRPQRRRRRRPAAQPGRSPRVVPEPRQARLGARPSASRCRTTPSAAPR
jgi:hypothetical protein